MLKSSQLFLFLLILSTSSLFSQTGSIKGVVTDAKSGETLIGCNVLIQGTDKGTITDFDGNYEIPEVPTGDYNLVISYVSYENQIVRVSVKNGETAEVNVQMSESAIELESVTVKATRKTDTEVALLNILKTSNMVVSGISNQQIAKSQDKDASEVVRRIPGVTIREGRFIIVRGLIERYNSVWLNNSSTPSSEADIRAFSFDVIPSNAIDRILIYKTPAPELPADFAGAAIQIFTKSNADENSLSFSYGVGYNSQATGNEDFRTYKKGKTDWLGYDDGTRSLPAGYPESPTAISELVNNPTPETKDKVNTIGRSFNKDWESEQKTPGINQSASITLSRRFLAGKVSIGNLTSLNYSNSYTYFEGDKRAYDGYDVNADQPYINHQFMNQRSTNSVRVGGLMNWLFIFGNNQRIEFRNILNQFGDSYVNTRTGYDNASSSDLRQSELFYQSRTTYSGQLSGTHKMNNDLAHLSWTLGYAYANRKQPDTRRVTSYVPAGEDLPYTYLFTRDPDPRLFGRLYLGNHENIYTANINFSQKLLLSEQFIPELKVGTYIENKTRQFDARNIGFIKSGFPSSALFQQPLDTIFADKNINYDKGIRIAEKTSASDSYRAENQLYAGYLAFNLPVTSKWNVYTGARVENNTQESFISTIDTAVYSNPKTDIFFTLNTTYNFTEKTLLRFAYGRSVNRPEFREVSPFVYYDFEQVASIYGNTALKNCYVNNYDLRFEWYPSNGESITIGGFYKQFDNTIEAHLRVFGSDLSYQYENTQEAYSAGVELDIRKNLGTLAGNNEGGFLRDFTLVLNAALIKSEVNTNDPNERDSVRVMQGQSPYIFNAGLFWQNEKANLTLSVLYNVIGKRIIFVGDQSNPHTWEMPRNSLDFTLIKSIGKNFQIKAGIKDLLNNNIRWVQNFDFKKADQTETVTREVPYFTYKPGTIFNLGLTYTIR